MSDLVHMTPDAVFEKYGVTPKQYRSLAALVGESSDNLPGVPGVGPKTAAKWIAEFGELEKILAVADSIGGKVGEALRAHVDQVQLNYELNRLVEDAPVDKAIESYAKRDYDASVVHATLDALEFSALRPRLFAAWPSNSQSTAQAPAAKSSGSGKAKSSADPDSEGSGVKSTASANDSASETFDVVTKKVSETELGKWPLDPSHCLHRVTGEVALALLKQLLS
jgi:hypothetical protein